MYRAMSTCVSYKLSTSHDAYLYNKPTILHTRPVKLVFVGNVSRTKILLARLSVKYFHQTSESFSLVALSQNIRGKPCYC